MVTWAWAVLRLKYLHRYNQMFVTRSGCLYWGCYVEWKCFISRLIGFSVATAHVICGVCRFRVSADFMGRFSRVALGQKSLVQISPSLSYWNSSRANLVGHVVSAYHLRNGFSDTSRRCRLHWQLCGALARSAVILWSPMVGIYRMLHSFWACCGGKLVYCSSTAVW